MRGKNGEPLSKVPIQFTFEHKLIAETISKVLKTDKDGIIHLGKLKHISKITA